MTRAPGKLFAARWLCGVLILVFSFNIALAFPLCANMRAPTRSSASLSFCSAPEYGRKGCCTSKDDRAIQRTFTSMNISDSRCADVVKQILCVQCDAYSATLLGQIAQDQRMVPYLCTSDSSTNNSVSGQGYCSDVWEACQNVTIKNSPFSPSLSPGAPAPSSSLKAMLAFEDGSLGSVFSSKGDFCAGFGPSNITSDYCFSGVPFVPPPPPSNYSFPENICVEKVGEDSYLNLIPHPDGSNRVAVTSQTGYAWLASLPGPGNPLKFDVSKPFLDISDRVTDENELGFLGFAFHPDFRNNGRFFVSYNCDKQKWADCGSTCACNEDTNCNPSDLRNAQKGPDASDPCRYSSIIAEYTVNSSTNPSASPLLAEFANPKEVRRIFTMSLPYTTHHGGQLLFGPLDNYLYFMMGDGGSNGDPFNFSQNKKSLLGKILRLDVDNLPSALEISKQGLWGFYTTPPSNPFVGQNGSRPEIWALGLHNPWRCSFDSQHPAYFYCGDVGQDKEEEVNLISKGGNYGWRVYEGNLSYVPPLSPGGNTSAKSIDPIFPAFGYPHPIGNPGGAYASITGGFVSYSREDPCVYGKYVYADLYGAMSVAAELPKFSGDYQTQRVNLKCSSKSPLECSYTDPNSTTVPNLQFILSFGVDNSNNFYILSGNGVYRIVNPGNCDSICNEILPALPPTLPPIQAATPPSPISQPAVSPLPSSAYHVRYLRVAHLLVFLSTCALAVIVHR